MQCLLWQQPSPHGCSGLTTATTYPNTEIFCCFSPPQAVISKDTTNVRYLVKTNAASLYRRQSKKVLQQLHVMHNAMKAYCSSIHQKGTDCYARYLRLFRKIYRLLWNWKTAATSSLLIYGSILCLFLNMKHFKSLNHTTVCVTFHQNCCPSRYTIKV